jgi:hypothetical protein
LIKNRIFKIIKVEIFDNINDNYKIKRLLYHFNLIFLIFFNLKERIELQKKGFDLLFQQVEAKKAEIVSLQADLSELNTYLIDKNEPVRSPLEIERLKGEIRDLTNAKFNLELSVNKCKLYIHLFKFLHFLILNSTHKYTTSGNVKNVHI